MKIRTDFVTNSSSSSFIVSVKKNNENVSFNSNDLKKMEDYESYNQHELKTIKDIIDNLTNKSDINEIINSSDNNDIKQFFHCLKPIKDEKDIINLIKNEYIWDNLDDLAIMVDEEYSSIFKEYLDKLKNNKIYYAPSVSDCDDTYWYFNMLIDIYLDNISINDIRH